MPNIVKPSGINRLWASGGTKVDPGVSKINIGWVVELPPYQYQNWVDNRQDTFIAHINQHGIPEWDSETEYQGNLSYAQGSDGLIYKCIQTHTNRSPTNPINNTYWVLAFETYGSVAVVQNTLNTHIANYQTLTGLTNLSAARANLGVFSRSESDNRFAALLGNAANQFRVANATMPSHAVPLGQLNSLLVPATEVASGVVQIATVGDVENGTNDSKAITPAKGQAVYLKKSQNFADVPDKAAARVNLGLSDSATLPSSEFLKSANNLSDLTNVVVARNNLGLGTASTAATGDFLRTNQNFSDVPNKPLAIANLGLSDMATTPSANVMFKGQNLAGLTSPAAARSNLGLADSATLPSSTWMRGSGNLSELTNPQAARNNLGLSTGAVLNILGVSGILDLTSSLGPNGFMRFGPITVQWGNTSQIPSNSITTVTFPVPFSSVYFTIGGYTGDAGTSGTDAVSVVSRTNSNMRLRCSGDNTALPVNWLAIGAT